MSLTHQASLRDYGSGRPHPSLGEDLSHWQPSFAGAPRELFSLESNRLFRGALLHVTHFPNLGATHNVRAGCGPSSFRDQLPGATNEIGCSPGGNGSSRSAGSSQPLQFVVSATATVKGQESHRGRVGPGLTCSYRP